MILSLCMALLSGFVLSLNTVSIQYTIMANFDIDQANYDGSCMCGVVLIPVFIYFRKQYEFMDVAVATLVVFFVTAGIICFSRAL